MPQVLTLSYLVSGALCLILVLSATLDFTRHPRVIATIVRLGYKPTFAKVLGSIKAAGALGIATGPLIRPLGLLATELVAVYFLCATLAHFKVRDPLSEAVPALGLFVFSCAAVLLHMAV